MTDLAETADEGATEKALNEDLERFFDRGGSRIPVKSTIEGRWLLWNPNGADDVLSRFEGNVFLNPKDQSWIAAGTAFGLGPSYTSYSINYNPESAMLTWKVRGGGITVGSCNLDGAAIRCLSSLGDGVGFLLVQTSRIYIEGTMYYLEGESFFKVTKLPD